ncbi:hypothetical protein OG994_26990 [Micromonospora globbae]|uniref:Class F sortase n=1 Tax=Micromonospora globbae TaxID=1894969 RepID=A0ABZ1S3Y7_9ACTN|nr:hypothetical protein [Micromonospora globbae]
MGVEADDRLRRGVLAGATVLVLVAGGWWWRANAPDGTRAGSPRDVAAAPVGGTDPVRLGPADGRAGAVVRVDPATGAAVLVTEGDAALPVDPGPRRRAEPGTMTQGLVLPRDPDALWHDAVTLTRQRTVSQQVGGEDTPPAAYLLQYRCTGPGTLRVSITGGRVVNRAPAVCDGAIRALVVVGTGGPLRVWLASAGTEWVRVAVQLVPAG